MKNIFYFILCILFSNLVCGQNYETQARLAAKDRKIPTKEIETFVKNYVSEAKKYNANKNSNTFTLPPITTSICDDGGFETNDFNNWGWTILENRLNGNHIDYYNTLSATSSIKTSNLNYYGSITPSQWEIVSVSNDELFPTLPKVHNGMKALRLGKPELPNVSPNCSAESIIKTVNINSNNSNISFWYAVVLHDPTTLTNVTHTATESPAFGVRVHTTSGTVSYIPLLPSIPGFATNPISSVNNPFWTSAILPDYSLTEEFRMRPWTCAKLDLSNFVGQTIGIEFIVNDCAHGGHMGYAYLDDICMGCAGSDNGDASITAISKDCGPSAMVSGTYTLPHSSNVTGTLTSLQAQLYQSGLPVGSSITIPSSYINSTAHTFSFPMSLFGTVASGNYDIVIQGNFNFSGNNFSTISSTSGLISGANNDWKSVCPQSDINCCNNKLQMVTASEVPPSYPYNEGTYAIEKYNITVPNDIPITEVKVNVTSFEWKSDKEDCKQCQIKPANLGSLYGGFNIGGTFVGSNPQPYGSGVAATSNNNEIIFTFPTGKNFVVGDFMQLTYLLPPEKDLSCCQTKAHVCFKISWKDINCGYCEITTCSDIDLKNSTELRAGFSLPNRLMLYLNTRNIFALGHADGY